MTHKTASWTFSLCAVTLCVFVPSGATAGESADVSFGYAFSTYLEEGGGSAPLGAYLSIAGPKRDLGIELDVAWHRDTAGTITLNTFTAALGPRLLVGRGQVRPFVHVLGGLRHDRIEGESNTAWGAMAGGGVDIPAGDRLSVRLGADFQIFFEEGENLKTLRLTAGLTF